MYKLNITLVLHKMLLKETRGNPSLAFFGVCKIGIDCIWW